MCSCTMKRSLKLLLLLLVSCASGLYEWDPYGYVLYCPCMGRFGNQAAHFLGALQFAKDLNRTLALPPFITYVGQGNVLFHDWFKVEVVQEYHKSLPLEEFLEEFGNDKWIPGNRTGYCYRPRNDNSSDCYMKEGNPFGPFWDRLGVNFDKSVFTYISYDTHQKTIRQHWEDKFPPNSHPILAFKGAPASFPVKKYNRHLQRYLKWSDVLMNEANEYLMNTVNGQKFIAIHLRIGSDWKIACDHAVGKRSYMESLQCLEDLPDDVTVTQDICFPSTNRIINDLRVIIKMTSITNVFIGSDIKPPLTELKEGLGPNVEIYYMKPHGPQLDVIMFELSDHFIGSCVSSLTAFATRARHIRGDPTSFWGLISDDKHNEL